VNEARKASVLLSGGLDSATVLAIATAQGYECHCLSIDYGQRHRVELEAAKQVAVALGGMGGEDARSALEQMLTNEGLDAAVRRSARMALQRLKMDEAEEGRTEPPAPEGSTLGGQK